MQDLRPQVPLRAVGRVTDVMRVVTQDIEDREARFVLTPVERDVRHCPRCHRDWPLSTENCPECLAWLGQSARRLRSYRIELPSRLTHSDSSRSCDHSIKHAAALAIAVSFDSLPGSSLDEAIMRFVSDLDDVVKRFGGKLVHSSSGGEIPTAVFAGGADESFHVWAAMHAAFEVRKLGIALNAGGWPRTGVRVALNVGPVMVGLDESPSLVWGGVLEQARLLAEQASDGMVAVTAAVSQRVETAFDLFAVGLPDRSVSEPAFAIIGPKQPTSHRVGEQHRGPIVGRQRELSALRHALESLRNGRGGKVSLIGEPGSGKTKLLLHWIRASSDSGLLNGTAVCQGMAASYGNAPGWLLRSLVQDALKATETDELGHALAALGLPYDEHDTLQKLIDGRDPSSASLAIALRSFLAAVAGPKGLTVILDDLHWADELSLKTLEDITSSRDNQHLLLLSFRPSAETRLMKLAAGGVVLRLTALGSGDVSAFLRLRLDGNDIEPGARQILVEQARGNALYVEEAVELLRETGQIRFTGGRWTLSGAPEEIALPHGVPAVIMTRIDHLFSERLNELQRGVTFAGTFERTRMLAKITEIEDQIGAWLDRLETIDVGDRSVIRSHLRRLERADFEILMLRMRLGTPRPRNARLAAAIDRLDSGSIGDYAGEVQAQTDAGNLQIAHEALETADRAARRGEYEDAVTLYRLVMKSDQDPPGRGRASLLQRLADLEWRAGDVNSAHRHLLSAISASTGHQRSAPLLELAELALDRGDIATADRSLDEAKRLGVEDPAIRDRIAVLTIETAVARKQVDEARSRAEHVELDRLEPWLATRLALALGRAALSEGQLQIARHWVTTAVDRIPDDSEHHVSDALYALAAQAGLKQDAPRTCGQRDAGRSS